MNGRCKDCEYWTQHVAGKTSDLGSGDWGKPATYDMGACGHPKLAYVTYGDKTASDGLGYEDGDDYWADLETGPDFGCVHFEPKIKSNSGDERW